MNRNIVIAISVVALVVAGIIGTFHTSASTSSRQAAQITQLRSQLTKVQAADKTMGAELAAAKAAINGSHRDLITCADIDSMLNGYTSANAGDYIGLNQYLTANGAGYTIPLPAHCLNG